MLRIRMKILHNLQCLMVRESPGRPPNKTILFSTWTRCFDFFQKKSASIFDPFVMVLQIRTFTSKFAWHFCAGSANLCCGFIYLDPKRHDFNFHFELRLRATPSPMQEKLSKLSSSILLHHASLCIIMIILLSSGLRPSSWWSSSMTHDRETL